MTAHVNRKELPYTTPPYSWEFIATRETGQYRVRDAKDNAVGHGDTQQEAETIVWVLNELFGELDTAKAAKAANPKP